MSVEPSKSDYPWVRRSRIVETSDSSIPDFEYTIAPFDDRYPPAAMDLARLHRELLPTSPASKLGLDFLASFYYSTLVKDGHVFGCAAYVDDQPAGFWVGVEDSNGFMRKALRRHFIRLSMILLWSILKDPRRIFGMLEAWQLLRVREGSDELIGETLTIGTMPAFRSRAFKESTSVLISQDLAFTGQVEFCRRSVPLVSMFVDQDNVRSQQFNEERGWKRTESSAEGWKTPSYEYRVCPEDFFSD